MTADRGRGGTACGALLYVANYGTYHGAPVATLLRQLGRKAASTDSLRFIDAQKG